MNIKHTTARTILAVTLLASPAVAGNSAAGTMGSTDPNANFAY